MLNERMPQDDSMADSDRISPPYALLLLPAPPSSAVRQLKDAYGRALSQVFSDLVKGPNSRNRIAQLDIALTVPGILSPEYRPRARIFASLQRLLANFYTVIGAISAAQDVELDGPGGVDVRIVFVDDTAPASEPHGPLQGPVIDLRTLAGSERGWDQVYVLDSAEGQQLASLFKPYAGPRSYITVPSGVASASHEPLLRADADRGAHINDSVVLGGTFDHLHIGHKLLLTAMAFTLDPVDEPESAEQRYFVVGITGDAMLVNKKYREFLESWEERWHSVASFLTAIIDFAPSKDNANAIQRINKPGPNGKQVVVKISSNLSIRLVEISDPFGPTITEENFRALIVSAETRAGGKAVNDERAKKGWAPLEVLEVDVLQSGAVEEVADTSAQNFESKISSTDIRRRRMELSQA